MPVENDLLSQAVLTPFVDTEYVNIAYGIEVDSDEETYQAGVFFSAYSNSGRSHEQIGVAYNLFATSYRTNFTGIGYGLFSVYGNMTGAQAGFFNFADEMIGAQVGGVGNLAEKDMVGAQVGGIGNFAGVSMTGAQVGGIGNFAWLSMTGIQVAGFGNISHGNMTGVQAAAGFNYATRMEGLQLSLLGSVSETSCGLQVGAYNMIAYTFSSEYRENHTWFCD